MKPHERIRALAGCNNMKKRNIYIMIFWFIVIVQQITTFLNYIAYKGIFRSLGDYFEYFISGEKGVINYLLVVLVLIVFFRILLIKEDLKLKKYILLPLVLIILLEVLIILVDLIFLNIDKWSF